MRHDVAFERASNRWVCSWCGLGGPTTEVFEIAPCPGAGEYDPGLPALDAVDADGLNTRVHEWFTGEGQRVADMVGAKAAERGAYDLELLGRTMAGFLDVEPNDPADAKQFHLMIGVLFYAEGKIARALSALKSGRLPNPDDWIDLSVYGRMASYIQEHKQWP